MPVDYRPDEEKPEPRVATRRCPVCAWEGVVAAGSPDEQDCPQCHATTELVAEAPAAPEVKTKNPHAAALGRLGGVRGGKARAQALSAKRRKEIARNAALARWKKR
jgi:hypothetical protein